MKMGTIASPWRYDVTAADAIRPDNRRRTAILRYAYLAIWQMVEILQQLLFWINPWKGALGHSRP